MISSSRLSKGILLFVLMIMLTQIMSFTPVSATSEMGYDLNYPVATQGSACAIREPTVTTSSAEYPANPIVVDAPIGPTDWFFDKDGDGFGDGTIYVRSIEQPINYVNNLLDCDDGDATVHPGATELNDGKDNDCDGSIDEGDPVWYLDGDGDGFGDGSTGIKSGTQPLGYVADGSDCNDGDATTHPGAPEILDGKDNDCDGTTDEDIIGYKDADGDTFGDATSTTTFSGTLPAGVSINPFDCDDSDKNINPLATEVMDGVDNNCDGIIDEGFKWYRDGDGDNFGNPAAEVIQLTAPANYVADNTDCDDGNKNINPGAAEILNGLDDDCDGFIDEDFKTTWYLDLDGDGYGILPSVEAVDRPKDYTDKFGDCDDNDGKVYPGAVELIDGIDNNCNGLVDEVTLYYDADGDDFGNDYLRIHAIPPAVAYTDNGLDCDDTNRDINPNAKELLDGLDNDCDGLIDEDFVSRWYKDSDGDNYGNPSSYVDQVDQPVDYVADGTDCDDTDASVNPGAVEAYNGVDDNCDGVIDEGFVIVKWYYDADGDGYGDELVMKEDISQPAGYVDNPYDCNDADASINPGATELKDGIDNDCDGQVDEDFIVTWYKDGDGDGYGNPSSTTPAIDQPTGYVADNTDCDDTDAAIHPGASELNDGIDNDCDGLVDEDFTSTSKWFKDSDGDSYGDPTTGMEAELQPDGYVADNTDCDDTNFDVHPGAEETKDGIDNNCNGVTDEGFDDTTSDDPTDDAPELPVPGFTLNGALAVFGLMLLGNRVYLRKRK